MTTGVTNLPRANVWKAVSAAVVALTLYVYFSSPEEVVVTPTGQILGILNQARASMQGRTFWKDQLDQAHRTFRWEQGEPERAAERAAGLRQVIETVERENKKIREQVYRESPNLRPSPAARQSEALRELADRIEQAETERMLEQLRLERIANLERTLPLLEARAR